MTLLEQILSYFSIKKIDREQIKLFKKKDLIEQEMKQVLDFEINTGERVISGKELCQKTLPQDQLEFLRKNFPDAYHSYWDYQDLLVKKQITTGRLEMLVDAEKYISRYRQLEQILKTASKNGTINTPKTIDAVARLGIEMDYYLNRCVENHNGMAGYIESLDDILKQEIKKEFRHNMHSVVSGEEKIFEKTKNLLKKNGVSPRKVLERIKYLKEYNIRYITSQERTNQVINEGTYDGAQKPKRSRSAADIEFHKKLNKEIKEYEQYKKAEQQKINQQLQQDARKVRRMKSIGAQKLAQYKAWAENTKFEITKQIQRAEASVINIINKTYDPAFKIQPHQAHDVTKTVGTEYKKYQEIAHQTYKKLDNIRLNNRNNFSALWKNMKNDPQTSSSFWFKNYEAMHNINERGIAIARKKATSPKPQPTQSNKKQFKTPSGAPKTKKRRIEFQRKYGHLVKQAKRNQKLKLEQMRYAQNEKYWTTVTNHEQKHYFPENQRIKTSLSVTTERPLSIGSTTQSRYMPYQSNTSFFTPSKNKILSFYRSLSSAPSGFKHGMAQKWTNFKYSRMAPRQAYLHSVHQYYRTTQHNKFVNQHIRPQIRIVPNPWAKAGMSLVIFFVYALPLYASDKATDKAIDYIAPKTHHSTRGHIKTATMFPTLAAVDFGIYRLAQFAIPKLGETGFLKLLLSRTIGTATLKQFIVRGQLHALAFVVGYGIGTYLNGKMQESANNGNRFCQHMRNKFEGIFIPFIDPGENHHWYKDHNTNSWEIRKNSKPLQMKDLHKHLTFHERKFLDYWKNPLYRKKYIQHYKILENIKEQGIDYLLNYEAGEGFKNYNSYLKDSYHPILPSNIILQNRGKSVNENSLDLNWNEIFLRAKKSGSDFRRMYAPVLQITVNKLLNKHIGIDPMHCFTMDDITAIDHYLTYRNYNHERALKDLKSSPIYYFKGKSHIIQDPMNDLIITLQKDQIKLQKEMLAMKATFHRGAISLYLNNITSIIHYVFKGTRKISPHIKNKDFLFLQQWGQSNCIDTWTNMNAKQCDIQLKLINQSIRNLISLIKKNSKKETIKKRTRKAAPYFNKQLKYLKKWQNNYIALLNKTPKLDEVLIKKQSENISFKLDDMASSTKRNEVYKKIKNIKSQYASKKKLYKQYGKQILILQTKKMGKITFASHSMR